MLNNEPHWGARLRHLLQNQQNLKQLVLASAVGVEESTISRWLAGGNIKISHLIALCEYLDVSVDWLLLGRGTPVLHKYVGENHDALKKLPQDIKSDLYQLIEKLSIQPD
ncbi:helix-turn-helix transcriptional regulator [Paraneptunicella aestuarii]|uniref:helix-turn-helix domain-containing protein n=1 Tax=Paraneptunicella aestuarii TaxID=2831148 RepID=UPI001E4CA657|nr:helix-turn-helix transcriptional regulator [Paraneptunicella aestuarii]UAA39856.1 helix-turn-helix transcriptional regulator [Paraneptunicella aestuarii]